MNISILLGAGFSVAAGFPTAKQLSENIVNASSLDFCIYAGNLCERPESIPYRKVLMKPFENLLALIHFYSYLHCNHFDYEHFYDFYWKIRGISDLFAGEELDMRIKEINGLYQKLVCFYLDKADKMAKQYTEYYEHFNSFVRDSAQRDMVYIHTLNHDTLLEQMLDGQYSDGFSTTGSLFHCNEHDIQMFSESNYQGNILLYKLHGSLDRYLYTYQNDFSKHEYIKIPLQSGIDIEDIRNLNDIDKPCLQCLIPDFLTGATTKIRRYKEPFYASMFECFAKNLQNSDTIYIIGYGGHDKEINKYLLTHARSKPIYIIDPFPNNELQRLSDKLGTNSRIIPKTIKECDVALLHTS